MFKQLEQTLEDPRRAALIGAAGGALKGALVGVAVGKLAIGLTIGALGGAAFALALRQCNQKPLALPSEF